MPVFLSAREAYKVAVSVAEPRIREVERPTILVMAVPYVLATALAFDLGERYNVVAPNLAAGETAPSVRWDAVLRFADVSIPKDFSGLVIELPITSFKDPVMVTVKDNTTPVHLTSKNPMLEVVALLEHHLLSSV